MNPHHHGRFAVALSMALLAALAARSAAQGPPPPPPIPPLPAPPVPPQNPITEQKRLLGKVLFWDEQLSSDHSTACGTCHINSTAGADPRLAGHPGFDEIFGTPDDVVGSQGVARMDQLGFYVLDPLFGMAPQVTRRSAQGVPGSLWAANLFWDGRATSQFVNPQTGLVSIPVGGGLESQAVGPIVSDVEMAKENRQWTEVIARLESVDPLALAANLPPDVAAGLAGDPSYADLFEDAFGDPAITAERIAFAIATYERTLVPNQTPWDAFNAGDPNAMTPNQVAGWNFFRASQCNICHTAPIFSNNTFRNIGLRPLAEDEGRFEVTGNNPDRGRFKVPSLRNTGLKRTWMHNGQLSSLPEVLDFYQPANGQVQFPNNQDPLVPAINIPPPVRPQLVDFLANALTDPRVANEQFPFDRPRLHSEITTDMARLCDCLNGPGAAPTPPAPATAAQCLADFDRDTDGDVDLRDAVRFERVYAE